jgi:hypothetical protein
MNLLELCAVTICVAGITIVAAHSQQTSSTNTYGNQEGRYRLVVTTGQYGDTSYVIDSQTGRVWHSVADTEKKLMVFAVTPYENIHNELGLIPNEFSISVSSKHSDTNSVNR